MSTEIPYGGVGVVTPEAVELSFETAGVGSRMIAELLDILLEGAVMFAALIASAAVGSTPLGLAGIFIAVFLVLFGYPVAAETWLRGRTLGKLAMGLRVVTTEGAPVRFRHAIVRAALGLVDIWLLWGAVAIVTILATPRNQRLGDLAAGTLVLRERTGAAQPAPVRFSVPADWEPYTASLDVTGLSAADYEAVRAFLVRAPSLDSATRHRIAARIATPLLGRLRHQPPPGVSAEALLACVAAAYQRRQAPAWPGPMDRPREPTQQGVVASAPPGGQPAPKEVIPTTGGFVAPE